LSKVKDGPAIRQRNMTIRTAVMTFLFI